MIRTLIVGAVLAVMATQAYADANGDRFAAAVQDYTRDDHRAWVINRLMKFNLGPKCWPKVAVNQSGAVEAASYVVSDVVDYAKANGGGDWSSMEQNKRQLAAAMDAFRERFFVTVNVDGDDCEGERKTPWIRYWSSVVGAIEKHPFPSGKVFVTLDVSSKHKEIKIDVGSDGATVTVHAPKDREAKNEELIGQTFKKIHEGVTTAAGGIDAFAFACRESSHDESAALIILKLHTFNIGKKCMAKLADRDKEQAVYMAGFVTGAIQRWAKRTGSDDWDEIERRVRDRARARDEIAADIAELRKRFSVTVNVEGDDCDTSLQSPWLGYWREALTMLEGLPPKSTKIAVTINATSKAKDLSVAIGKDGASYVITGPRDRLPANLHARIEAAYMKVAKDRDSVAARVQNNKDSKLAKAGGNPFPQHGVPYSDAKVRGIPSYTRGSNYTKGAVVSTGMSSNPHTLVFRCLEMKCTDSPGVSSQWKSIGWAHPD